ncbi:MAG: M23 family metallopeptidase [Pseudomonadota bacterium]|nr:M23 family metallopeptidase [Pseudomonadota bacterium]
MYQWRDMMAEGGGSAAMPRGFMRPAAVRRKRFSLLVDLAAEPLSPKWWRGAATLGLLCSATGVMAPTFEPLTMPSADRPSEAEAREYRDAGVAPLAMGGRSGGQMAASARVEPLLAAPERAQIALDARLGEGDRIEALLMRIGASSGEAVAIGRMVHAVAPRGLDGGTQIAIRLGKRHGAGFRSVDRIALRAGFDTDLIVERGPTGLAARVTRILVDQRPRRIRGRVGDGLYWSLRGSGVSPQAAADYLKALATRLDVGADLGPDDRFDLVIAHRRAATGEERSGPLLYAGVQRLGGAPIEMLKWTVSGRTGWYDAASLSQVSASALAWPVSARITSGFGLRRHPILGYARLHKGIDFGARWGSPIVASADGVISRAGWAGGYGQQVRIAHGNEIATSYSHMSRILVSPGSAVRQGQLIGYVGTTGLSTGPHLHYETYRGGVAVDPRSVRFVSQAAIDPAEVARFKARLAQLLGMHKR